jgi:glutamate-1-semialdehyde 2,1-aminomutase
MAHFDQARVAPGGFMPQVGTLSGNPVAAVAGLATLSILRRPGAYERLFANGRAIREALGDALRDAGIPATIPGEPPMFDAVFSPARVRNYRDSISGDLTMAKRFNAKLREFGVFKSPSKIYVSLAHDEADIALAANAFREAARAV